MSKQGDNIRKRKDGRWEGRYLQEIDGKKKNRSVYAHTYSEVKEKLKEVKKKEEMHVQTALTLDALSGPWFAEVEATLKYSTYNKYLDIYEKHIRPQLGNLPVSDINSDMVAKILPRQLSQSVQKSTYCVLSQLLRFSASHFQQPQRSLEPYAVVRPAKPVEILSQTDQRKLLEILYQNMDSYKLGVVVCLSIGLRLGEICALKWEDIDFESQTLHVNRTVQRVRKAEGDKKTTLVVGAPKTICSKREIPLPEPLIRLLSQFPQEGDYVIKGDSPMDPRSYQYKFRSYLREAGIDQTHFHILRHTLATNCISNGADVKSVSELLGHSNVNITMNKYVHPAMESKRECLNALTTQYSQKMGQVS